MEVVEIVWTIEYCLKVVIKINKIKYTAIIIFLALIVVVPVRACFYNPGPSESPSPTPTPTSEPTETPLPSEQPLSTPEPQNQGFSATSEVNPPKGPDCTEVPFAPTILGFKRISSTSIEVNWTHTDPISNYRVFYGLDKDNLVWNTTVLGGWDVTLNDLPANTPIWVKIYATDLVCLGNGGLTIDP